MTDATQYVSAEKKQQLEEELVELKKEKMPAIAKQIDAARQMGDLSENAEYHQAREDLAWAQSRVKEIQYILDNAQIVASTGGSTVSVGSTIVVKKDGKEREYSIVGAQEADPLEGRISNESPLGQAFMGKSKGDRVVVETPGGEQEFKIISVN